MREFSNEDMKAASGGTATSSATSSATVSQTVNGVTTTQSFSQTGPNYAFVDVVMINGVVVRNNQGSG